MVEYLVRTWSRFPVTVPGRAVNGVLAFAPDLVCRSVIPLAVSIRTDVELVAI